MGKLKKKGTSGAAVAFITRNQAINRLQLTLKDFRRLCILKGIYPVEPKHKKKVNSGSSANKTYYLLKDIQYLSHEPIIWKFWDFKIFMKKLTRAKGRKDFDSIKRIRENKPFYKLDHVVKERYPKFVDALRDMDDTLSMCFLYAMFPKSKILPLELIELCRRLTLEFMLYVIETKSLRKVFISIKGYYYQADIMGQTVTWIVPHQFVFDRITDVDFNVMKTFVEFYITFLGFINYKLFSSVNLYYPPKLQNIVNQSIDDQEEDEVDYNYDELISSLNTPLVTVKNNEQISNPDEFEDEDEAVDSSKLTFHKMVKLQNLFKGLKFFLNREVPRESLVFVIRSFGGTVSWDKNLYSGATFDEDDQTITHQIVDREEITNKILNRYYIQPQWVYDSVNARLLLPVENYFIGEVLPPHLSPFIEESPNDYVPPEKEALLKLQSGIADDDSNDKQRIEEAVNKDAEQNRNKNKESEISVVPLVRPGNVEKMNKQKMDETLAAEEKRLSTLMIPKKKKRLYNKIMYGKKRKTKEAEKLRAKRKEYELNKDKKTSLKRWNITTN